MRIQTVTVTLPRLGSPLRAEITAEVTQPRCGSFNPRDGGTPPEPGEVNYRRVIWWEGSQRIEGTAEELIEEWVGDDDTNAWLELDRRVLEAAR